MSELTKIRRTQARRAAASIEFVLFVPLLLVLFFVVMTMGWASLVKTESLVQVRQELWKNRHTAPAAHRTNSNVRYPSELNRLTQGTGLNSSALVQENLRAEFETLFDSNAQLRTQSILVANTWDHRYLRFQCERNHPRLVPDRLVYRAVWGGPDLRFLSRITSVFFRN